MVLVVHPRNQASIEQRGIEFAFPTQVVHVNNGADGVAKSANPIQAQP